MTKYGAVETEDQRAERLLRIGFDVATRVHEEHVNEVVREFRGLDYGELRDLALLMAACVDVTRPVSEVVWWTAVDRMPIKPFTKYNGLRPCGTRAAYRRHITRGEAPDLACELAFRREEIERKKRHRSSRAADHRGEGLAA